MNIIIKQLTIEEKDNFSNFIKDQDADDLNFFTRWQDHSISKIHLNNIINDECSKSVDDGIRIIAIYDKKICGFGLIDFFQSPKKNHVAVVGTIVDKHMRGKKIGTLLIQKEISICQEFKKKKLRATVHEHNVGSMKLHLSAGFHEEGKFIGEEFDGKFRNIVSLAKFLQ